MQFLICVFALVATALAVSPPYFPQPGPQVGLTKEGSARILKYDQDQKGDGAYSYSYETENGISAGETNVPKSAGPNGELAPSVVGGYAYTAPDGTPISVRYTGGEEGFVAEGAHIPVGPAIPEAILRALAWNAAHPEEEAQWDPAYKPVLQPVYQG